jgi:hypothetical protein
MKIAFICGSLEPGRDGVGDYVRLLAGKLKMHGRQVIAVALNEPHILNEYNGIQKVGNVDLNVFRIPNDFSTRKRFQHLKKWIDVFDPDWISIQFVPFSFHSKGLPFLISFYLRKLTRRRKVHIMFHELWVGMNIGSPIKQIYWGTLQRFLIYSLIKKLQPAVIHTNTRLYQNKISKLGFKVGYLPLFSNIPRLAENHRFKLAVKNHKQISFVLFGSIHPGAPIRSFAREAALYAKENNIQILLLIVGRCGIESEHWAIEWRRAGMRVKILGEQTSNCISAILNQASVGISTTPGLLAEKSGAVAAMREHGLPVICVSEPWYPRGINNLAFPGEVLTYHSGNLENCLENLKSVPSYYSVSEVSHQFINALSP